MLSQETQASLETLDPFVVYIAPDVGARAIRRGLPLDLELDHQHWGFAAEVLDRLRADDPAIAAEVARANAETMAIGLAAKDFHGAWEDLSLRQRARSLSATACWHERQPRYCTGRLPGPVPSRISRGKLNHLDWDGGEHVL